MICEKKSYLAAWSLAEYWAVLLPAVDLLEQHGGFDIYASCHLSSPVKNPYKSNVIRNTSWISMYLLGLLQVLLQLTNLHQECAHGLTTYPKTH